MRRLTLLIALFAAVVFTGCATKSPYSRTHSFGARYERYEPSVVEIARLRKGGTLHDFEISDLDIVSFSDHVKSILRSKFTNARFARYTSSTAQMLLGGLAGATAAFDGSATTVAALALTSAALPQLGGIFNAKARAETYQDAVRLIEEAEVDYLSAAGTPSSRVLTDSGVDLYRRVTTTIHIVEKAIVGQLPTLKEMKDVSGEGESTRPGKRARVIQTLRGGSRVVTERTETRVTRQPRERNPVVIEEPSKPDETDPLKPEPMTTQARKRRLIEALRALSDAEAAPLVARFKAADAETEPKPRVQLQKIIARTDDPAVLGQMEQSLNLPPAP